MVIGSVGGGGVWLAICTLSLSLRAVHFMHMDACQVELKDQPSITGYIKKKYLRHHIVQAASPIEELQTLYRAVDPEDVDAQVKAGWIFAVRVRVLFGEHTSDQNLGVEQHLVTSRRWFSGT